MVDQKTKQFDIAPFTAIIKQLKQLRATHQFGIVIGGGNIFRGHEKSKQFGITPSIGHQVGMLATIINGLIIKDIIEHHNLAATHFSALSCPELGKPIIHQEIESALQNDHILVFTGGTGNPFFTTDTNAVLRGLQMNTAEVWKGTSVDGVYDKDPGKYTDATLIKQLTYSHAIEQKLGIMDATAFALAQQYKQQIRIFNIFTANALLKAAQNQTFGSTINN